MNKKSIVFVILISLFSISFFFFQYIKEFKADLVGAAYSTSKPANGHLWSEMECSSYLCLTGDNVGVGTFSPSQKLEVNGSGLFSGDVCNGGGKCLSSIFQTNVIAGTNPTCPAGQTAIMKAYNGTWYIASQPTTWTQVTCGIVMSSDGTPLLVNSQHSTGNCTNAGGTVVSGSGNNMCRFNSSSCPAGWVKYLNWSTTAATQLSITGSTTCPQAPNPAGYPACNTATGSHSWNNIAVESKTPCVRVACNYAGGGCSSVCYDNSIPRCFIEGSTAGVVDCGGIGYASITQIGCY
jgi:hypothetical protein